MSSRHFSFPVGIAEYSHEPYTLQNTLEFGGKFYVCGTGRQPILRNKMENNHYYLLALAAIAKELRYRGEEPPCSVTICAGLPLTGFGREKKAFREYLLSSSQPVNPVCFRFQGLSVTDAQIERILSEKACSMEETARKEELEMTLRRVLREELKASPCNPVPQQEETIPQAMMGEE